MNKDDLAAKLAKATLDDMSRPMSNKDDVAGLVERLDAATKDDHERGCQGRYYACSCGYDDSNAQLLQDSKEALTTLSARVETLEAEALEWKTQHENLLSVRLQDLAAMQAKIDTLEKELAFKNEAIRLTKGCPGKVVLRGGFYKVECYKKKYARRVLAGDTNHG